MDSNTPDPLLFEKQGGHISWHPCPTLPSTSLRVETQGSFNTLTLDVGRRAGVSDGGGGHFQERLLLLASKAGR